MSTNKIDCLRAIRVQENEYDINITLVGNDDNHVAETPIAINKTTVIVPIRANATPGGDLGSFSFADLEGTLAHDNSLQEVTNIFLSREDGSAPEKNTMVKIKRESYPPPFMDKDTADNHDIQFKSTSTPTSVFIEELEITRNTNPGVTHRVRLRIMCDGITYSINNISIITHNLSGTNCIAVTLAEGEGSLEESIDINFSNPNNYVVDNGIALLIVPPDEDPAEYTESSALFFVEP